MEKTISVNAIFNRINALKEKCLTDTVKNILYVLLWCGVILGLSNSGNTMDQTSRDYWYSIFGIFFCLYVMCRRKTKLFSIPSLIISGSYLGAVIFYMVMTRDDYGEVYRNTLIVRFMFIWLMLITGFDMLLYRRSLIRLQSLKRNFTIFTLLVTVLMFIFDYQSAIWFVFPVIFFALTPMTAKEWDALTYQIAAGSCLAYAGFMVYSYIFYRGVYFSDGRYQGAFAYTETAGLFTSTALLSAIYLLWRAIKRAKKNVFEIIFVSAYIIYSTVMLLVFQDRSSIVGILVIGLVLYLMHEYSKGKTNFIFALAITLLSAVALVQLFIFMLRGVDYEAIETFAERISIGAISNGISYLSMKLHGIAYSTKTNGVFEPRTVLNSIDRLLSNRLTIWYLEIKRITPFGVDDVSVTFPTGRHEGHAHNVYIDWLLRYGIIGGIPVIGWFFTSVAMSIKGVYEKKKEYILTFIMLIFAAAFLLVERALWNNLWGFIILIMIYPFLIKFKE